MVAMIIILDASLTASKQDPELELGSDDSQRSIPVEEGVFRRSEFAMDYENMPVDENHNRSLTEYYQNRAYPGAPPIIPHEVLSEKGIGGKSCLQCHQNGGFVTQFKAYAPVSPHPEMINCKQCHVPAKTKNNAFVGTDWKKLDAPQLGNAALIGSPPIIPHSLQMRENCLSCHAGPAAPREIRVSHPMRVNCRQCHVPSTQKPLIEWQPLDAFSRNINTTE